MLRTFLGYCYTLLRSYARKASYITNNDEADARGRRTRQLLLLQYTSCLVLNYMDYIVQSGDTLLRIANSYGTIASNVVTQGGSHPDPYSLIPGQTLVVLPENHVVVDGETLVSLAKKYRTTPDRILAANPELQGSLKVGQSVRLA